MIIYVAESSTNFIYTDLKDIYIYTRNGFSGYYHYLCFGLWDWDIVDGFRFWKTTNRKRSASSAVQDQSHFEEVV